MLLNKIIFIVHLMECMTMLNEQKELSREIGHKCEIIHNKQIMTCSSLATLTI